MSVHTSDDSSGGEQNFPAVGDVIEGRYELVGVLGKGGMGIVVEARHLRLERKVAIKLMHPHLTKNTEFLRRFEREVLIAKDLAHTNTVRIYDFGVTEADVMYLVMEHLVGRELSDEISEGPIAIGRVVELGTQLLDGLGEAHALNVVHRDLKPGNIFISRDRRGRDVVKILDFGIAKSLAPATTQITRTGELIGTARYLAPEVYLDGKASKSADIYSCGLVLLEMLYGCTVFEATSVGRLLMQHSRMPVIFPPSLSMHPLAAIIRRAVAKNPQQRYADAEAMFEALDNIEQTQFEDMVLPAEEIETAKARMTDAFEETVGNRGEDRQGTDANSSRTYSVVFPGRQKTVQVNYNFQDRNTEIVVLDEALDEEQIDASSMVVTVDDAGVDAQWDRASTVVETSRQDTVVETPRQDTVVETPRKATVVERPSPARHDVESPGQAAPEEAGRRRPMPTGRIAATTEEPSEFGLLGRGRWEDLDEQGIGWEDGQHRGDEHRISDRGRTQKEIPTGRIARAQGGSDQQAAVGSQPPVAQSPLAISRDSAAPTSYSFDDMVSALQSRSGLVLAISAGLVAVIGAGFWFAQSETTEIEEEPLGVESQSGAEQLVADDQPAREYPSEELPVAQAGDDEEPSPQAMVVEEDIDEESQEDREQDQDQEDRGDDEEESASSPAQAPEQVEEEASSPSPSTEPQRRERRPEPPRRRAPRPAESASSAPREEPEETDDESSDDDASSAFESILQEHMGE